MGMGGVAQMVGSGISNIFSTIANAEDVAAMNKAAANIIAQEQGAAKQGGDIFQQSLDKSTPQAAESQIKQGQDQALNEDNRLQGQLSLQDIIGGGGGSKPNVTSGTAGAKIAAGTQAGAKNQGYTNYSLQQYLKDVTANSALGLNNARAQGIASTLGPMEEQASQTGNELAGIGQTIGAALGAGGAAASMYNGASASSAAKVGAQQQLYQNVPFSTIAANTPDAADQFLGGNPFTNLLQTWGQSGVGTQ